MGFFDDLQAHMSRSSDISKIDTLVSAEEKVLYDNYNALGQIYYHKNFSSPSDEEKALFDAIGESLKKLDSLNKLYIFAKGVKVCPNCNTEAPFEVAFCSGCGTKLEMPPAPEVSFPGLKYCYGCGVRIEDESEFCPYCGTKIESPEKAAQPAAASKFCHNCGNPVSDGAEFCSECGAKLNGSVQQSEQSVNAFDAQPFVSEQIQTAAEPVLQTVEAASENVQVIFAQQSDEGRSDEAEVTEIAKPEVPETAMSEEAPEAEICEPETPEISETEMSESPDAGSEVPKAVSEVSEAESEEPEPFVTAEPEKNAEEPKSDAFGMKKINTSLDLSPKKSDTFSARHDFDALRGEKTCHACGKTLPATAVFCGYCGATLK